MVKEDKKSITWMYANYGTPAMVIEVAKVEALTGRCSQPTMTVERIVDLKLRFKNGVEISGVPAGLKLALECSGIVTEIVRHPTYNPENMPKATKKEMSNLRSK